MVLVQKYLNLNKGFYISTDVDCMQKDIDIANGVGRCQPGEFEMEKLRQNLTSGKKCTSRTKLTAQIRGDVDFRTGVANTGLVVLSLNDYSCCKLGRL